MAMLRTTFLRPARDALEGLERCLEPVAGKSRGVRALAWIVAGLILGWWVYVPVHELLHAGACLAAGGTVSRLEIDPLYGGGLLARLIPWVEPVSGPYAGRLAGFDTGASPWLASDLVHLATDLGPFLLTIFPGVWWLRRAGDRGRPFLYGAALPCALAPFLSLTGDAYEIAAIVLTWFPPWSEAALASLLRGEDLLVVAPTLAADPTFAPSLTAWLGLLLATALGALWAFGVYGLGRLWTFPKALV